MKSATAELSDLVLKFYGAAGEPEFWPEALDLAASAFNARGAILPGADLSEGSILHSHGMEPVLQQFFEQGWHQCDERTIAALRYDLLSNLATDQFLFTPEEIARSPYYEGFARSAGVPWFCAAALTVRGPGQYIALSLQRSETQGPFSTEDLAKLQHVLPHLRNAAALAMKLSHRHAAGVLEGLDLAGTAALIVAADGRVLAANAAFERPGHSALRISGGRVRAALPAQQSLLMGLIAGMSVPQSGSAGEAAFAPAGPIVLRSEDGSAPLVVRLAPWCPARSGRLGLEGVLVTLTAPSGPVATCETLLRRLFALTPREAEIMALLGRGLDVSRIAVQLSLSRDTVRFHLKSILGKTGTHRQSEVVALCLRLADKPASL